MKRVNVISDHILTSLGNNTAEVWESMANHKTGVMLHDAPHLFTETFWASLISDERIESFSATEGIEGDFTRFEKMCLLSATNAIRNCEIDVSSPDTLFILSTTKGNIDLLERSKKEKYDPERLFLWNTGRLICRYFNNPNPPLVISNACISGVIAIITAFDYLSAGQYKHAVIIGADMATEFVISGFQSFKSLSNGPCKPFDLNRDGLNLGEGVGTLVLTTDDPDSETEGHICILGGAGANDANHISGPSRTGEGLYTAVQHALEVSGLEAKDIVYISAHGTATPYNDEMESRAFSWAGLEHAYVNSMKGYFGHTLGAAGIIETIIAIESMKKSKMLKTLGYSEYGVPEKINILDKNTEAEIQYCLKTASGFGGCNGALILGKCNK